MDGPVQYRILKVITSTLNCTQKENVNKCTWWKTEVAWAPRDPHYCECGCILKFLGILQGQPHVEHMALFQIKA